MKVLHLDIETTPHLAYAWGLGKQVIAANQLHQRGRVLCFAAKWDGEKDVFFHHDFYGNRPRELAQEAYDLLDEADAVVHYNGTRFDLPRLHELLLSQGLGPPSPVFEIDLLDTVRRRFSFPSNRLDYVVTELGLGSKLATGGMKLWVDAVFGTGERRTKALAKMRRYNIRDVRLQEKLYRALRPWIKKHPNPALYGEGAIDRPTCTACGSPRVQYRGYYHTQTQAYRRVYCKACGKWSRERSTALPLVQRRNILTGL